MPPRDPNDDDDDEEDEEDGDAESDEDEPAVIREPDEYSHPGGARLGDAAGGGRDVVTLTDRRRGGTP
jgi:hypothetical protein